MCGRYANHIQDMHDWAAILIDWPMQGSTGFNVSPSQLIPTLTADGGVVLRWGLIPPWQRGESTKYSTFNARIESIAEKPAYRNAWARGQRCLIPALGYYEWRQEGGAKQPYFVALEDGNPMVFAGIWEPASEGSEHGSCSIITKPAQEYLAALHPRMPLMVKPDLAGDWLSSADQDLLTEISNTTVSGTSYYPVCRQVNNPRNQGEELINPIQPTNLF